MVLAMRADDEGTEGEQGALCGQRVGAHLQLSVRAQRTSLLERRAAAVLTVARRARRRHGCKWAGELHSKSQAPESSARDPLSRPDSCHSTCILYPVSKLRSPSTITQPRVACLIQWSMQMSTFLPVCSIPLSASRLQCTDLDTGMASWFAFHLSTDACHGLNILHFLIKS